MVVSTNYRLGALGFLVYGSGSEAITGNFGIKVKVTVALLINTKALPTVV